jgi:hypothetical protein
MAIGFALLGGLLLWFVVGSRGAWWLKLAAILATTSFTFVAWHALESFSGWPTDRTPPARALLLSSEVDEPNAIYLWVIGNEDGGALGYRPGATEPRAYRLPYTRELHAEIDRANRLAKTGQQVEIRGASSTRGGAHRGSRLAIRVYALPSAPRAPKHASFGRE